MPIDRSNAVSVSIDRATASMRGAERAKILFTLEEASVILGVSRSEIERLVASDRLKAATLGPRRLIHRDDLEVFASSLPKGAA